MGWKSTTGFICLGLMGLGMLSMALDPKGSQAPKTLTPAQAETVCRERLGLPEDPHSSLLKQALRTCLDTESGGAVSKLAALTTTMDRAWRGSKEWTEACKLRAEITHGDMLQCIIIRPIPPSKRASGYKSSPGSS